MKRRALASALAVLACSACGTNVTPASGLMLVIQSDAVLGSDFDTISLTINGKPVDTSKLTLPSSLGVTGAPGTKVTVEARGLRDGALRLAWLKETTIPSGRVAELDVNLMRDCYDKCVAIGATDTLDTVCDPDTLGTDPTTSSCNPPAPLNVNLLPTYDSAKDPTLHAELAIKSGCAAPNAYCTSSVTCESVVGSVKSTGTLSCASSCQRIEPTTNCRPAAFDQASSWPTSSGFDAAQNGRSNVVGPTTAPTITTQAQLAPLGITGDGHVLVHAQTPPRLATITLSDLQAAPVVLLDALPTNPLPGYTILAPLTCCGDASTLTVSSSGSIFGISQTGVLFRYDDPKNPPAVGLLGYSDRSTERNLKAFVGTTRGMALAGDGTAYITSGFGVSAVDVSSPDPTKWRVLWVQGQCPSARSVPSIAGNQSVYVSLDGGGICVLKPDGRFRLYDAEDGIAGVAPSTVAVDVDGTAIFGTDKGLLYARRPATDQSPEVAWAVSLGGPITTGAALGPDGTAYVATDAPNPRLIAVDRNGRVKWSAPISGAGAAATPTVDPNGTVFVGDRGIQNGNIAYGGGFIYAFHPNGTLAWKLGTARPITGPIVLTKDGIVTTRNGSLALLTSKP